jgi:hypothetical protein
MARPAGGPPVVVLVPRMQLWFQDIGKLDWVKVTFETPARAGAGGAQHGMGQPPEIAERMQGNAVE